LSEQVNATSNFWGAVNGPAGVGSGNGDAVSAGVLFTPFLMVANPNAGL
jgi:hypothetical protein